MKAIKISTIIIGIIFLTSLSLHAEKIHCKKYSGRYNDYNLTISFSKNGKMLIEVEEKDGGGYFSTPGGYVIKDKRIDFFYRGLNRTVYLENDQMMASPYTFSLNEDYKTIIILMEDKSFPSSCG